MALYRHTIYSPRSACQARQARDRTTRPATIRAMTETRLWDRAAALPARSDGRRLRRGRNADCRPADRRRAVRLHARCGAALRDAPAADRGAGEHGARRGRHADGRGRPPSGRCEGDDDPSGHGRRWPTTSCGSPTATSCARTRASTDWAPSARSGTVRAGSTTRISPVRRGSTSRSRRCRWRPCRTRSSIRPATARTCSPPAAAWSPAPTSSAAARRSWSSATTRARPRWPATGPTSTSRLAVDRDTGIILRLVESIGGDDHPACRSRRARARCADAAVRLRLRLPHRDDDAVLRPPLSRLAVRVSSAGSRGRMRFRKEDPGDGTRAGPAAPARLTAAASDPRVTPRNPASIARRPTDSRRADPVRISKGAGCPTADPRSRLE